MEGRGAKEETETKGRLGTCRDWGKVGIGLMSQSGVREGTQMKSGWDLKGCGLGNAGNKLSVTTRKDSLENLE